MVYRRYHWEQSEICDGGECTTLTAYVRIEGKWTRIGYYGSECKKFEPLDLQKEEEDRLQKQKLESIKSEMKETKQNSRERLKTIKNELNANKSFFKQQTKAYEQDSK
jgi:hypothetical protein